MTDVTSDRNYIYQFIEEQKRRLDTLYPIADRMINCETDTGKDNVPQRIKDTASLDFEDNFTGTSLDYTKWNTQLPWGPEVIINNEQQYYTDVENGFVGLGYPDPFSFDGQNLGITAEYHPELTNTLFNGNLPSDFSSGVITTADNFLIEPGSFIEVCAKMPCDTQGFWGAIWLLNKYYADNGDPRATGANGKFDPEIDWEFVEGNGGGFGGGPYDTSCALPAYHYDGGFCKIDANGFGCNPANGFNDGAVSQQCDGTPLGTNTNPPTGFDPVCNMGDTCGDFHTYGWEWETDRVIYYMDGVPVRSICDPNIVPQVPMYLIINQAVGGNFPGPADPADYPATMLIDYVRIYQR